MNRLIVSLFFVAQIPFSAVAAVCDHVPSKVIGPKVTKLLGGGSAGTAAVGIGMKAMGWYAITNATTGAAMLGSTAAGTSAAGTVGIVGGTAGAIGTAGAVVMSPFVIVPAVITAAGIGIYEGGCYVSSK